MKNKGRTGKLSIDHAAIRRALAEDAPEGDITSEATIPKNAICTARLVAKQNLTLAGIDLFRAVFLEVNPKIRVVRHYRDGVEIAKGAQVARITGPARDVLLAERVALNYLQRMCGVATLTKQYTGAIAGTSAVILDTRKTIPGYRDLDKYSVRCGGGQNHRRDLSDMALIKENHIALAGGITEAVTRARAHIGKRKMIEVEVTSIAELREALGAGADRIMFDNMTPKQVKRCVEIVAGQAQTEASGNMTIKTVRAYAKTGVDYISVGAITHSAPAADLSLLVDVRQ